MHTALRIIFLTVGAVSLVSGVASSLGFSFTLGVALSLVLGVLLTLYGVFYKRLLSLLPKWVPIALCALTALTAILITALYICGMSDNADNKEDVVIVLGAGINGTEIGSNLKNRLDTAIEYYESNKDALIVVSGGKGSGEDISEALAMERYLVSNGVPIESIIKEDASTSTYENFKFSKSILDERLGSGNYRALFITNSFHIFRAESIANDCGFVNITHIHAKTPIHTIIPNGIREILAVAKELIF